MLYQRARGATASARFCAVKTRASATAITLSLASLALSATAADAATRDVYAGQSIANAVSAASAGDTIVVHRGSYSKPSISKQFASPVLISGAAGETVSVAGFDFRGAKNISVRDLRIPGMVYAERSSYLRFDNVVVTPTLTNDDGFRFSNYTNNVVVAGAKVLSGRFNMMIWGESDAAAPATIRVQDSELTAARIDNIQIGRGRDVTVEHNYIHHPQVNGDHNDGLQAIGVDGLRVSRNTFTTLGDSFDSASHDQAMMIAHAPDSSGRRCRNVEIVNNLIHHWRGSGINFAGVDNARVINNTSYDNNGGWSALGFTDANGFVNTGVEVTNNVLNRFTYRGTTFVRVANNHVTDGSGTGANKTTGDPRFVDRASYRLQSTSKAVNTADLVTAPSLDLDGLARTAPADRGAREYR
jgi:hypothetical protein